MAMSECSAYSSLQADSKVKFAPWPKSRRPLGADRLWPRGSHSELSHMASAVDDSTINIVVIIIIIIVQRLCCLWRYINQFNLKKIARVNGKNS